MYVVLYYHCLYVCSTVQSLPVHMYVVLYNHCLYMCCVVRSLQVLTVRTYIHTYCCVHVCTYVYIVQKYSMHVCMYTCLYILYQNIIMQVQYVHVFWNNIGLFLLSFMQLSWEYMHAHANMCTCSCILIGTCIHACTHASYNRCYYFVIRKKMLKQYATVTSLVLVVGLSVSDWSEADWRVVCLVFRKLPHLRILHSNACITCSTPSFVVCEIGIFPVF